MSATVVTLMVLGGLAGGLTGGFLIASWKFWRALRTLNRQARQLGTTVNSRVAAVPFRRCLRDCGRPALDGHPTCGAPECERGEAHRWQQGGVRS